MIITNKYIEDNRTSKGAWTSPQIESLGESWPLIKGWKTRVIGTLITSKNARIFESKITLKQMRSAI